MTIGSYKVLFFSIDKPWQRLTSRLRILAPRDGRSAPDNTRRDCRQECMQVHKKAGRGQYREQVQLPVSEVNTSACRSGLWTLDCQSPN
ncbi:hypothetical protein BaRGS_00037686 [Batillaria attramentaria]|uniref:Uncharacterized protein n=1 Tax=Batillaria attramentaria TaxID=370345 RepID=A0ABD0J8T3_9CAEN